MGMSLGMKIDFENLMGVGVGMGMEMTFKNGV